jgi:hypothetical protein
MNLLRFYYCSQAISRLSEWKIVSSQHTNGRNSGKFDGLDILEVDKYELFYDYKCKNILASEDPGKIVRLK